MFTLNDNVFSKDKKRQWYRAYEDRYRGSREIIAERLKIYLPFILPLKEISDSSKIVDLGCGRGEWLELTSMYGFDVSGVDLDESMLAACQERGFNVFKADVVSHLASLPDSSQTVVTAFHLVEHISFDALQQLMEEAFRVLRPGGMLILETPNAENITVGTARFYSDPTHIRPVSLQLLSFMTGFIGFSRTKILRLNEPAQCNDGYPSLTVVLDGVSPDCAIVAQKAANAEIMNLVDDAFSRTYGITLEDVVVKYNQGIEDNIRRVSQLENKMCQLERIIQNLYCSRSWQITAPLRAGSRWLNKLINARDNSDRRGERRGK